MQEQEFYNDSDLKNLLQKVGFDEPSEDFTNQVMLGVATALATKKRNFMIVVIFSAILFVVSAYFVLDYFMLFNSIKLFVLSVFSVIASFFENIFSFAGNLSKTKLPSLLVISIVAGLILLGIDGFFSRKKMA